MKDISEKDELLAKKIAGTLDESLDQIDELSLQRLKSARKVALAQQPEIRVRTLGRRGLMFGVAAGFALLLAAPLIWQQHVAFAPDQDIEMALQEIPPSAEELDDMDMLMALEDTDV